MMQKSDHMLQEMLSFSAAGGGVAKLRRAIIQTAVSGGMSGPPPANTPRAWPVVPLSECVDVLDAQRVPVNEPERAKRIAGKKPADLFPYYGATRQVGVIDGYIFDEELVLLGEDGVPFHDPERPKAYIVSGKCWVNNHAHALRGRGVDNRFLCHVLNVADYSERITGTTRMKLTQGKMLDIPVPVPPVAEQKHIVTKVDQLMALCDDLEAKQTKKRALATQSTRSALVALTTAENADDLAAAWRRIQTRFENFVSRPDDVALLRQACIELAVRGRLAGNLPSDGSGQDLLRKIREENQKAGKAKNPRQGEANVTEAAQPFQIPSHWVWVCWRDLFQSSEAGWSPQCASRPRVGDEWGVLKVSAVSWDRFDPDENKALLPGVEPRRDCAVQAGDFLMSRANTAALVGRSVVVAQQPTRLLMSDKTIRCHFSPLVDRSFMNYYNRTETARQHYIANASGTSDSMKNISRDVILDIPAPLPPLAEQKRIVAKVDHLMSLLDDLEAKLRKQEDAATRLAESLAAAVAA